MHACILSGFYAEPPDDGDDSPSTCDGPCALHDVDSDVSEPSICNVRRDHPVPAQLSAADDDQPPPGTGAATSEDRPPTMLSGGSAPQVVPGRYRLLLMMVVIASLATRRCVVISVGLRLVTVTCLELVRLTCRLPASFDYR